MVYFDDYPERCEQNFKEGFYYVTRDKDDITLYNIFYIMEYKYGEYKIKEFYSDKGIKTVNLNSDEILLEMTPYSFVELFPEYFMSMPRNEN